jgi:hypothetical protein
MADKTAARTRAEAHFSAAEARYLLVKTELAKQRIAFDDRTEKLKALRLAREAEEAAAKGHHPSAPTAKKMIKGKRL